MEVMEIEVRKRPRRSDNVNAVDEGNDVDLGSVFLAIKAFLGRAFGLLAEQSSTSISASTKKGSMTIDEYFLKMKQFRDELAIAGQPISDEDLILYILGGLGSEYEAIIVNLTSRSDSLSLREVGASYHITPDLDTINRPADYKGKAKVVVGNDNSPPILHIGSNVFHSKSNSKPLILQNILHVPNVNKNLLSISQFTKDKNVTLECDDVSCLIKDKSTKQALLWGEVCDGLYKLQLPQAKSQATVKSASKNQSPTAFNFTTISNPVYDK
uniref:Retrovirus-related Pol polyprotein from transposon TNT 1-94-like beta-barrel domain-containing protein n=1 Tax=Cannabis sativa TaxID=3483 RepID=A0A803QRN3_CANSA